MDTDKKHNHSITEKIIGSAVKVSNKSGIGFLEKVYENAMMLELSKIGIKAKQQEPISVYYDTQVIGEYYTDLLVEDEIIVELKAIKNIDEVHIAQLINYLKACKKKCGLIINFGKSKIEIRRIVN